MDVLKRWTTGRQVLCWFIATMVVYLTMLFYTIPAVQNFAPGKVLFDLSPGGYSYASAMALLEALGSVGRETYLTLQLRMDMIYPGLFAVCYSLMFIWLFRKSYHSSSKLFYLCLIPVCAGLFDYMENAGIYFMLTSYPEISPKLVNFTSVLTILKSIFTTVFFILLLFGIGKALQSRVQKKT